TVCCGGSVVELPGNGRDVLAGPPAREGDPVTVQLVGLPAEQALLLVSLDAGAVPVPAFHGVLVTTPVLLLLPLNLGLNGQLSLTTTVPELGPGLESVNVLLQGLFG